MREIWKTIKGYDRYEISTKGNVRHIIHRRNLKYSYATNGYPQVKITDNNKKNISKCVHQLMADTFIHLKGKKEVIHHRNGNKSDCSLYNLEILKNSSIHFRLYHRKHFYSCFLCGKEVPTNRSNPNVKKHFCSKECHHKSVYEKKLCCVCNNEFEIRKSYIINRSKNPKFKNRVGIYCSNNCRRTGSNIFGRIKP